VTIHIANLPTTVTDADLAARFAVYGPVAEAIVFMDPATGLSRGAGRVELRDETAGRRAISLERGRLWDGRQILIQCRFSTIGGQA
jgi:RNA recognition motif-containing protein